MCFSAVASFVAGGALTVTGVVIMKKAKTKAEFPFCGDTECYSIFILYQELFFFLKNFFTQQARQEFLIK